MSAMRLLEGEVEDPSDRELERLQADVAALRQQLAIANQATLQARRDNTRALSALRRQLAPLYRALQDVFGELDEAGVEDGSPSVSPQVSAVWAAWKQKLPPACGKIIDALLLHRDLNSAQLKVACRLGTSTVSDAIYKLNKAGLIDKNGGRFSLKAL